MPTIPIKTTRKGGRSIILESLFKPRKTPNSKRTPSSVREYRPLPPSVEDGLTEIRDSIGKPSDLVVHCFGVQPFPTAVVYLSSLADVAELGTHVVEPLNKLLQAGGGLNPESVKSMISAAQITIADDLHHAVDLLLAGRALILIKDAGKALAIFFPGFPRRQIAEPPTESVLRGPREGFTDVLTDNIGMLRRWLKDPNLRVESRLLGERTKTETAVVYLNNVANSDIVREVHKRLEQINIDGIIDSGYVSQLIADNRLTIFPLLQETERPDKVAAAVLEGRVAILVDKSPFALIVPVTSAEFYQTPEDFCLNYWVGSFIRLLRGVGTFTSVTLPGLYVAIIGVNPGFAPTTLIQVLSSGRTQIPFPVVFEMFFALFVFEIFREAIVRVPKSVNLILGIAGGVLLGWLAVNSGLVAGATVIVVIFSTLASFSTANVSKEQAWRVVRYFMLFAGASFGVLGLTLAGLIVLTHMSSLKSFGVSYLAPWSPPLPTEEIDAYLILPWWLSYRRPPTYRPQQEDRLGGTTGEDEANA